ncbi:hypothetical protein STEG23_024900, partial [Scotinomys teguina]
MRKRRCRSYRYKEAELEKQMSKVTVHPSGVFDIVEDSIAIIMVFLSYNKRCWNLHAGHYGQNGASNTALIVL